jgi:hypothetical protein
VITIIALDLAFVLLGETVHILRQSSYRQREQRISQEILDLNDAISKDMATYSGLIGFVLNEVSVSNSAAASWDIITYMKYSGLIDSVLNKKVDYNEACGFLTPHFPDSKSLLCFADIQTSHAIEDDQKPYYYWYLLWLYKQLWSPYLYTDKCNWNILDCPHTGPHSICFHGKWANESDFIGELAHHHQYKNSSVAGTYCIYAFEYLRLFCNPYHWRTKLKDNLDFYDMLRHQEWTVENDAHATIEVLIKRTMQTTIAQFISQDSAYASTMKLRVSERAKLLKSMIDNDEIQIIMDNGSFAQVCNEHWIVAQLPQDNPLREHFSNELKWLYLKYLYRIKKEVETNKHECFSRDSILSFVNCVAFFNLTIMEKESMYESLMILTTPN